MTGSRVRAFLRSFLLQAGWNYDRMQHLGVAFTLLPEIRRIHATEEQQARALLRHLEYFNTQPYMAAPLLGASIRLEEEIVLGTKSPDDVASFKASIMGSYGAIGDSFFWAAARPLGAAIAVALILLGAGATGPIVFVLGFDALMLTLRAWGFFAGARLGPMVVAKLARIEFPRLTRRLKIAAAFVAGMTVAFWAVGFHTSNAHVSSEVVAFPALVLAAGAARRGLSPALTAGLAAVLAALSERWLTALG